MDSTHIKAGFIQLMGRNYITPKVTFALPARNLIIIDGTRPLNMTRSVVPRSAT
jgi:hypothetical protein